MARHTKENGLNGSPSLTDQTKSETPQSAAEMSQLNPLLFSFVAFAAVATMALTAIAVTLFRLRQNRLNVQRARRRRGPVSEMADDPKVEFLTMKPELKGDDVRQEIAGQEKRPEVSGEDARQEIAGEEKRPELGADFVVELDAELGIVEGDTGWDPVRWRAELLADDGAREMGGIDEH